MRRWLLVLGLSAAVLAGVFLYFLASRPGGRRREVIVLCGGSMRAALEEVIASYRAVCSDEVLATYGGSGELCAQLKLARKGDIYICHDPFMEWAEEQGLIDRWETLGVMHVVIVVPKGNPRNIRGLEDLARPGLRVGVGHSTHSTSGVIVAQILKNAPFGEALRRNIRVESKGHQQRIEDVRLGHLDAGIVWDAVAALYGKEVDVVPIDYKYVDAVSSATFKKRFQRADLRNVKVTAGLTVFGRDKEEAVRFYRYLVTRGREVFRRRGLNPPE